MGCVGEELHWLYREGVIAILRDSQGPGPLSPIIPLWEANSSGILVAAEPYCQGQDLG